MRANLSFNIILLLIVAFVKCNPINKTPDEGKLKIVYSNSTDKAISDESTNRIENINTTDTIEKQEVFNATDNPTSEVTEENIGVIISYSDEFGEFPFDNETVNIQVGCSGADGICVEVTTENLDNTTKSRGYNRANFEASCFSGYERAPDGSCQEVLYD
ncbi:unnamed protein product [Colias eurytheme]|nr:unnamed protein product [Colias eurytheme]